MTDRPEIARIAVKHLGPSDVEAVRLVVKCAKVCRRIVEASCDGTNIIFYANVRVQKSRTTKRAK